MHIKIDNNNTFMIYEYITDVSVPLVGDNKVNNISCILTLPKLL